MSNDVAGRLAQLIGLDEPTVTQQLMPNLASYTDAASLQSYLQDLLDGSPAAKAFISSYVSSRFPSASAPPSIVAASKSSTKKGPKPRFPQPASAPRPIGDKGLSAPVGTVYRKGHEDVTTAGSTQAQRRAAATSSPIPAATHIKPESAQQKPAQTTAELKPAAEEEALPYMAPTAEMLAVDAVIELLTQEEEDASQGGNLQKSSTVVIGADGKRKKVRPCFCHGRVHLPHAQVPQCTSCGLILCSSLLPSPLSQRSSCPSCAATPLLSPAARATLLSTLSSQRERLADAQRQRAIRVREERRLAKLEQRSERTPVELFPELGAAASGASRGPRPVDIAMGRAAPAPEAMRKAKVLTLNMKTHKLIAPKPKSKVKKAGASAATAPGATAQAAAAAATASAPTSSDDEGPRTEDEEDEEYDAGSLGIVADVDDDGFAMHGIAPPLDSLLLADSLRTQPKASWWDLPVQTELNYIAKDIRPKWSAHQAEEEVKEEDEGEAAKTAAEVGKRNVPGSAAPDQPKKGRSHKNKGKGKAKEALSSV